MTAAAAAASPSVSVKRKELTAVSRMKQTRRRTSKNAAAAAAIPPQAASAKGGRIDVRVKFMGDLPAVVGARSIALSLPADLRIRRLTTKWVLKKAAEKWLPREVIYRRKRGLSVPIANWINHGLRSEVDRLLAPQSALTISGQRLAGFDRFV